jgi:phenylacetate-CoA ligase
MRRYFESVNGELVFSARSGIPLVRYNIHDTGGILSFEDAIEPFAKQYLDRATELNINLKAWTSPFIYLSGRKDFTATIYAVNIYPENIKAALVDPKMRSWVTGKFTMATRNHKDMDQYFEINIELARGIKPESEYVAIAQQTIIAKLTRLNGEFRKLHAAIKTKAEPVVHLIAYGNQEHFSNGVKHKWVKNHG